MKKFLIVLLSASLLISCQKGVDAEIPQHKVAETLSNVSYGTDPAQKMDVYLPEGRTDTTKLIILVHGGAWMGGDKSDFSSFVPVLQQRLKGYAIANINYRLATISANHFPTQENDMKAAVDFLVQKAGDYHISQKIVLLGASAGAHLVLLQAYKYSTPKIKAAIDFFGPTDMVALYNSVPTGSLTQTALQIVMNGSPASNAPLYSQSSPINFVNAQSTPTLILHGTADDVVPIAQSNDLKAKLQSFGVVHQMVAYPNHGHDLWPAATMDDAFSKIEAFIKANVQ
jgi:acetyl esterase/lipase